MWMRRRDLGINEWKVVVSLGQTPFFIPLC
jgi:hypothetical protein